MPSLSMMMTEDGGQKIWRKKKRCVADHLPCQMMMLMKGDEGPKKHSLRRDVAHCDP